MDVPITGKQQPASLHFFGTVVANKQPHTKWDVSDSCHYRFYRRARHHSPESVGTGALDRSAFGLGRPQGFESGTDILSGSDVDCLPEGR